MEIRFPKAPLREAEEVLNEERDSIYKKELEIGLKQPSRKSRKKLRRQDFERVLNEEVLKEEVLKKIGII